MTLGATLAVNHPTQPTPSISNQNKQRKISTEKRKMKNRPKNRVSSMDFFSKIYSFIGGKHEQSWPLIGAKTVASAWSRAI